MTELQAFDELNQMDRREKVSYARKGQICLAVKDSLLHFQRINPETGEGCTWTEWVRLAAPWNSATCFAAVRDLEDLSDIPMEHLARVPEANIKILTQLSSAVRSSPAVLSAAETQRAEQFVETIKRDHPDQAIEARKPFRVVLTDSQLAQVEKAVLLSMSRGAMTRAEALEDLAVNYLADVAYEEAVEALHHE